MTRTKSKPRPRITKRTKVLVVLSSDGFVEVFGGREVDCHVAQRLAVDSIEAERMAEEISGRHLAQAIPRAFPARDAAHDRACRADYAGKGARYALAVGNS